MNPNSICLEVITVLYSSSKCHQNESPVSASKSEDRKWIDNGLGSFPSCWRRPFRVHIDGIMNLNVYKNILESHMLPYAHKRDLKDECFKNKCNRIMILKYF